MSIAAYFLHVLPLICKTKPPSDKTKGGEFETAQTQSALFDTFKRLARQLPNRGDVYFVCEKFRHSADAIHICNFDYSRN